MSASAHLQQPQPESNKGSRFWLLLLFVVIVVSAMSVVYSVHVTRKKVAQLDALYKERDQLEVEYGKLLLEKSASGSFAVVEYEAGHQLDMHVPSANEIVIVKR